MIPLARRLGARSCFVVHALIAAHAAGSVKPYDPCTMAIFKSSNRHALRQSDRVVCVSRYIAGLAESEGARKGDLRVVPNAVDVGRFSEFDDTSRDIDVLFVGRLSVEKGTDTLIRAVAPLSGDARVVVAGEGGDREQLESLASELGASVTFPGWVQKPDLPALVARSHVQVVPSRSEAQGMVALEALAAGTPVIASRVGGLPEAIVEGENGFLVEKDDVDGLRKTIVGALSDRDRIDRVRPTAQRTAARYSPAIIAGSLETAYLN